MIPLRRGGDVGSATTSNIDKCLMRRDPDRAGQTKKGPKAPLCPIRNVSFKQNDLPAGSETQQAEADQRQAGRLRYGREVDIGVGAWSTPSLTPTDVQPLALSKKFDT